MLRDKEKLKLEEMTRRVRNLPVAKLKVKDLVDFIAMETLCDESKLKLLLSILSIANSKKE
jgi:hypothetical protein